MKAALMAEALARQAEVASRASGNHLADAVDRGKRFTEELQRCDSATGRELISAWKELLTENFFTLLRKVDDVPTLANLDNNIGLGLEIATIRTRKE